MRPPTAYCGLICKVIFCWLSKHSFSLFSARVRRCSMMLTVCIRQGRGKEVCVLMQSFSLCSQVHMLHAWCESKRVYQLDKDSGAYTASATVVNQHTAHEQTHVHGHCIHNTCNSHTHMLVPITHAYLCDHVELRGDVLKGIGQLRRHRVRFQGHRHLRGLMAVTVDLMLLLCCCTLLRCLSDRLGRVTVGSLLSLLFATATLSAGCRTSHGRRASAGLE